MDAEVKTGKFVHIVGTLDLDSGDGKILYVNPATSSISSDAKPDPNVEIVGYKADGAEVSHTPVPLRRSSPEPGRTNSVGLVQIDIPASPDLKSIALVYRGKEVSRFDAGVPSPPAAAAAKPTLGLAAPGTLLQSRRRLTIDDLGAVGPEAEVSYTVQVKPDNADIWNTIAVGRETPHVEIDRNQFPGSKRATIRVLRTTGVQEEVLAEDTVDLH